MQRITSLVLAALLVIAGSCFPKVAAQTSRDVVGQALVIRRSETKASMPTAVVLQSVGPVKNIREKFIGETNARWIKAADGGFVKLETGENVVLVEAEGLTNDELALALRRDRDVLVSEPVQPLYSDKLEQQQPSAPKVQSDQVSTTSPWYGNSETRRLIGADVAEQAIHSQGLVGNNTRARIDVFDTTFYTSTQQLAMHQPTDGHWGHNFRNPSDPG